MSAQKTSPLLVCTTDCDSCVADQMFTMIHAQRFLPISYVSGHGSESLLYQSVMVSEVQSYLVMSAPGHTGLFAFTSLPLSCTLHKEVVLTQAHATVSHVPPVKDEKEEENGRYSASLFPTALGMTREQSSSRLYSRLHS